MDSKEKEASLHAIVFVPRSDAFRGAKNVMKLDNFLRRPACLSIQERNVDVIGVSAVADVLGIPLCAR